MPISGGLGMEFKTKKQRSNYFRSVNTIINDGPPEWAKVPITFTEEDFKLKSTIHNDAMVIEVNIAGWIIGKVLVDNGSSTDILFLKTFEKMNLSQHMLHLPEYPLQGFRGKPIKPV
jgi:regulation of enolase protein 1 (concanavalin A-like superfamily)